MYLQTLSFDIDNIIIIYMYARIELNKRFNEYEEKSPGIYLYTMYIVRVLYASFSETLGENYITYKHLLRD